jgi:hypothetical protein
MKERKKDILVGHYPTVFASAYRILEYRRPASTRPSVFHKSAPFRNRKRIPPSLPYILRNKSPKKSGVFIGQNENSRAILRFGRGKIHKVTGPLDKDVFRAPLSWSAGLDSHEASRP